MKKWILATVAFIFVSFVSNVWANTSSDNKAAQATIENWFAAMKSDDMQKAGSYLLPQFVSIHTDKIVRNKDQEMDLIKNLHMKSYLLSNFKFSHSGDAIVVTYMDKGSEQIDNKSIDEKAAGRMAVLQKKEGKWLILAYANLDQIA